jgi:phosphatidylserine decarboxylase
MRLDKAVWPFAVGLAALGWVCGWLVQPWVALIPASGLLFVLYFFRDPRRITPADLRALISPADGTIVEAGPDRIAIFLSVFNVHVCRAPMSGRVAHIEHSPGRFLAAYREEASTQNERTAIVLEREGRQLTFVLIAGLVARRIVCRVKPGQNLAAGERVGLIRFGSRAEVELPPNSCVAVRPKQRVRAGETILAHLPAPGENHGRGEDSDERPGSPQSRSAES